MNELIGWLISQLVARLQVFPAYETTEESCSPGRKQYLTIRFRLDDAPSGVMWLRCPKLEQITVTSIHHGYHNNCWRPGFWHYYTVKLREECEIIS